MGLITVLPSSHVFLVRTCKLAGGGERINGGSVNIRNSLFYNNEALDGGAIM